jgi:hypothetical protein
MEILLALKKIGKIITTMKITLINSEQNGLIFYINPTTNSIIRVEIHSTSSLSKHSAFRILPFPNISVP